MSFLYMGGVGCLTWLTTSSLLIYTYEDNLSSKHFTSFYSMDLLLVLVTYLKI